MLHPPLVKTPLVGRATPLVASSEATRFLLVSFYATPPPTVLMAMALFIIAPDAFSLAAKLFFPRRTVEPLSALTLTPNW
jgi:hypothetical protein